MNVPEDPAIDQSFKEPLIDALRTEKDEVNTAFVYSKLSNEIIDYKIILELCRQHFRYLTKTTKPARKCVSHLNDKHSHNLSPPASPTKILGK